MGCCGSRENQPKTEGQAPEDNPKAKAAALEAKKEKTLKQVFDVYASKNGGGDTIPHFQKFPLLQDAGFQFTGLLANVLNGAARRKSVASLNQEVKQLNYDEVRQSVNPFWKDWDESKVDLTGGRYSTVSGAQGI